MAKLVFLKNTVSWLAGFFLEFCIVCTCVFTLLPNFVYIYFNLNLPGWRRIVVPAILICLFMLVAYRIIAAVLRRRSQSAGRVAEAVFWSFVGLLGCVTLFNMAGVFFQVSWPRVWTPFSILAGFFLVWFLRRRLSWRTFPLLLTVVIGVHIHLFINLKLTINV